MRTLPCTIQVLRRVDEEYWLISIANQDVPEAALACAGLSLGCLPKVTFQDTKTKELFALQNSPTWSATLGEKNVTVTKVWFETIWHLLLDVYYNGWKDTAHIDAAFHDHNTCVDITFSISPPGEPSR